jgi:hypothetical protein
MPVDVILIFAHFADFKVQANGKFLLGMVWQHFAFYICDFAGFLVEFLLAFCVKIVIVTPLLISLTTRAVYWSIKYTGIEISSRASYTT